jgi:hypothetical protein
VIDGLPSNSHYIAAIADDEDAAAQADPAAKPSPPRLTEWTPEVRALATVVDRIGELLRVQIARGSGKKAPALPLYPRPVTAAERLRRRRRLEKHHAVVARVLPNKQSE